MSEESRKPGVRHYVTLRRTVVQTQNVDFIGAAFAGSKMQHDVAAAYARDEAWVDEENKIEVISLSTENITWEVVE